MKTTVIIPIHKQFKYYKKIINGLERQSVLPDMVHVILDRPDPDESIDDIETSLNVKIITHDGKDAYIGNKTEGQPLFLTPYNRNLGIDTAIEDGCDKFIFIDGDCVPQEKLVESHLRKINYDIPVLTCGRRRESKYRWQDRREYMPELTHLELFRKNGTLIRNPELIKKSLIVWSCNIGMNMKTVRMLKKFNKKYYGRNEVFCSEFTGSWGGEDGFLGIEAFYCRVFISTIGEKKAGIEHIDHPRPSEKYTVEHLRYYAKQMEKIQKKIKIHPMDLSFFV